MVGKYYELPVGKQNKMYWWPKCVGELSRDLKKTMLVGRRGIVLERFSRVVLEFHLDITHQKTVYWRLLTKRDGDYRSCFFDLL